ncbi:MAG: aldehyde dehydrogenase family protein [Actinobacteria bacterium]|nr:aldehyde dehydrogenase family protein [Actinomycetota bacterium]
MTTLDESTSTSQSIAGRVAEVRANYRSGTTRPLDWRRRQLQAMVRMLKENEAEFQAALANDLGKPVAEGYISDIAFVVSEVKLMLKNLERWNKPRRVGTPLVAMPSRSRLVPEPLGVVLVIAPWNYPIQLLLVPAAGAIAAGNAVIMKPSEVSSATSGVLARLVDKYFDRSAIALVEGGVPETTELLDQHFDHIFYTGNGSVGRVVMAAAAKNLTPVTLELGGKSPVIVDDSANIEVAARRIAWGKWLNSGQTCVAPDYVLVDRKVESRFIDALHAAISEFYGDNPQTSESYGRIVSDRHFDRLTSMLGDGSVAIGGQHDAADRYIAPTVLVDVRHDSRIMAEEIFGPILPIIPVASVDEAITFVTERPHPLALYVFSERKAVVDRVVSRTTAGGVTVNGTLLHLTNPNLPFGGVGESGMGGYHGESSVRLFQHRKPVLSRGTRIDPKIAYPPYTEKKLKLFRKIL